MIQEQIPTDTELDLNEEIEGDDIENDGEDEENLEPFDPTQIRVRTRMITMDLILKRIQHDEINLAPDFQRNAGIWTRRAKSRLIESLLIRIPLPAFYIDATDDKNWVVVDGLQRISTFKSFILDKKLKLIGLEFLKDLEKKKYDQLSRDYQRRIDETELTVCLIEPGTPTEVKYNIFQRINTGGAPLNPQELRQAMNPGKATQILKKLANSPEFKRVINLSETKINRMDDHEFVLGFLAFSITNYKNYPVSKGRNYFLHEAMKKLNKIQDDFLEKLENKFVFSIKAAESIFGEDAFRKISNEQAKKSRVNKSLFEAWSITLSNLSEQDIQTLIERKERLKEIFISKMEADSDFLKSVSQAALKVQYRFSTIEEIVQEVLSC